MDFIFGPFHFDTRTRELRRDGAPVHLTPKAFELLEILIEERPRAVPKEELLARVWPESFISEANLPSLVAELRKALDDRARDPRYLRTVHGHGYAFCGSGSQRADPGSLSRGPHASAQEIHHRLVLPTREVVLAGAENLIGRTPDAAVWLENASISRRHARIVIAGSEATLEDLGSKNGTFRSSERVTRPVPLADRDVLQVGSVRMTYRALRTLDETETQSFQAGDPLPPWGEPVESDLTFQELS